jgi:chromate transport protein ChrA
MADIEDPDVDGGATATEAEPAECSRCMFMWLLGIAAVALVLVFQYSLEFSDSDQPPTTTVLYVAATVVGMLALYVAGWFLSIFSMLVIEWFRGNPEEQRLVDSLIQSDRCFLLESIHQFIRYTNRNVVHA